jgi:hypothetical protein
MPGAGGQSLGGVFAEIAMKGWEVFEGFVGRIKVKLDQVDDRAKQFTSALERVGSTATKAFGIGLAAVTGFVRAADPYGFQVLGLAIEQAARSVGRIFLPLMYDVIGVLNRITRYFNSLNDVQRAHILGWVRWGAEILLVTTVASKLIGVLSGLWSTASSVFTAIVAGTRLAATGFIELKAIVQTLPQALAVVRGVVASGGSALTALKARAAGIGSAITGALSGGSAAAAGLTTGVEAAGVGLAALGPIAAALAAVIGVLLLSLGAKFYESWRSGRGIIDSLKDAFAPVAAWFNAYIVPIGSQLKQLFNEVFAAITLAVEPLVPIIEGVFAAIGGVIRTTFEAAILMVRVFVNMVTAAIGGLYALAAGAKALLTGQNPVTAAQAAAESFRQRREQLVNGPDESKKKNNFEGSGYGDRSTYGLADAFTRLQQAQDMGIPPAVQKQIEKQEETTAAVQESNSMLGQILAAVTHTGTSQMWAKLAR